ncbi:hypothetical protein GCM10009801_73260 [Streptomyces albiaxialis]|uniref:Uncharacterized protein n=1 Tax=Streptomyces albiaxialis TaxID=329523 RepID=A0ABP5ILH1_9ACTN
MDTAVETFLVELEDIYRAADRDPRACAEDDVLAGLWAGLCPDARVHLLLRLAWCSHPEERPFPEPSDAASLWAYDLHQAAGRTRETAAEWCGAGPADVGALRHPGAEAAQCLAGPGDEGLSLTVAALLYASPGSGPRPPRGGLPLPRHRARWLRSA